MPETPRPYSPEWNMPSVSWREVNEACDESTGKIAPRVETIMILPVVPYTRLQRALHVVRICRWHRHQEGWHLLLQEGDDAAE